VIPSGPDIIRSAGYACFRGSSFMVGASYSVRQSGRYVGRSRLARTSPQAQPVHHPDARPRTVRTSLIARLTNLS
jgi:hypothetical protein